MRNANTERDKLIIHQSFNPIDMNQNINHLFKAEDFDWKQLDTIGINRKHLEEKGNLNLLLQGEETEPVSLKICTAVLSLTMDATLKAVEGPDGKPVLEINGLNTKEQV